MKQTDWKNKCQSPAENNSIVADELRLWVILHKNLLQKEKLYATPDEKYLRWNRTNDTNISHTQSGDLTTEPLWWSRFLNGQFSPDTYTGYIQGI